MLPIEIFGSENQNKPKLNHQPNLFVVVNRCSAYKNKNKHRICHQETNYSFKVVIHLRSTKYPTYFHRLYVEISYVIVQSFIKALQNQSLFQAFRFLCQIRIIFFVCFFGC